ncbi:MAG: deoxyribose-phosphate aldolase [Endomicrobiia bacterium]
MEIAKFIEYTNLKPYATEKDIIKLCKEAIRYGFFGVCVNPVYVKLCKEILKNTNVRICSVVGFPLGCNTTKVKVLESQQVICDGADEIDMVINLSALKSGNYEEVYKDISFVRKATEGKILKVILEVCYLTKKEKVIAVEIAKKAKADFIKTSTGFGTSGANVEDIKLIKSIVKENIGIKAAGGIKDKNTALKMIKAGADRIGTSSLIKD